MLCAPCDVLARRRLVRSDNSGGRPPDRSLFIRDAAEGQTRTILAFDTELAFAKDIACVLRGEHVTPAAFPDPAHRTGLLFADARTRFVELACHGSPVVMRLHLYACTRRQPPGAVAHLVVNAGLCRSYPATLPPDVIAKHAAAKFWAMMM